MGLFDQLGQKSGQQTQVTTDMIRREIGNIQANPFDYLKQRGFNIPPEMNDAKQITQYLLQSGQIGSGKLQQMVRMLQGVRG